MYRLIVVLALAFFANAALAQQTIVFSKPADVPAEKAKPYVPTISYRAKDFNAPRVWFNDPMPNQPMPRPPVNNNNNAEAMAAMNRQKNWTLLTPEQILGIQTPEQTLGLPDKNAEDKKLSLEEQFLLRENAAFEKNHNKEPANSTSGRTMDKDGFFSTAEKPDYYGSYHQSEQKEEPGAKFFNGLLSASRPEPRSEQNQGSTWNSAFTQPSQPKPTTEQLADMERFRALMEPTPEPVQPVVQTRFAAAPAPTPDPFLQASPSVNPAGRGLEPLGSSFSKPAGIQQMPGINTPPPAPPTVRPSWQAQPPPWTILGPQAKPNWSY